MQLFGNLPTHYHYQRSHWLVQRTKQNYEIQVTTADVRADLHIKADLSKEPATLPADSPFRDFREARKFAGPLPFTFDYESQTHSIIRVQGIRQDWNPRPVSLTVHRNTFLEQEAFLAV
jgi:hypothetical protein